MVICDLMKSTRVLGQERLYNMENDQALAAISEMLLFSFPVVFIHLEINYLACKVGSRFTS